MNSNEQAEDKQISLTRYTCDHRKEKKKNDDLENKK